jgi:glucosamine--fructose-6-phosphate aminotransferase (isomerizing)
MLDAIGALRGIGVEPIVISDADEALALGSRCIRLPGGVPEWLRPIVSIVPAQLLAYHVTRARGLDPDAPRYISKVTRTT